MENCELLSDLECDNAFVRHEAYEKISNLPNDSVEKRDITEYAASLGYKDIDELVASITLRDEGKRIDSADRCSKRDAIRSVLNKGIKSDISKMQKNQKSVSAIDSGSSANPFDFPARWVITACINMFIMFFLIALGVCIAVGLSANIFYIAFVFALIITIIKLSQYAIDNRNKKRLWEAFRKNGYDKAFEHYITVKNANELVDDTDSKQVDVHKALRILRDGSHDEKARLYAYMRTKPMGAALMSNIAAMSRETFDPKMCWITGAETAALLTIDDSETTDGYDPVINKYRIACNGYRVDAKSIPEEKMNKILEGDTKPSIGECFAYSSSKKQRNMCYISYHYYSLANHYVPNRYSRSNRLLGDHCYRAARYVHQHEQ